MLSSIVRATTTVIALSLSLGLVSANLVPETEPNQGLAARDSNEALYLVNCRSSDRRSSHDQSQMAYYRNGRSGSQHGELPDDTADMASLVRWEGSLITATFLGSGVTATSDIHEDAQSQELGTFVGIARNSYSQTFNCYKDSIRVLYSGLDFTGGVRTCHSIYYCFDV